MSGRAATPLSVLAEGSCLTALIIVAVLEQYIVIVVCVFRVESEDNPL